MGPYAGVDYNLTVHSRVVYNTFTYARVDLNPMPESTLSPSQGLWNWPLYYTTYSVKVFNPTPIKNQRGQNFKRQHFDIGYIFKHGSHWCVLLDMYKNCR
jgi:hypothetical protein